MSLGKTLAGKPPCSTRADYLYCNSWWVLTADTLNFLKEIQRVRVTSIHTIRNARYFQCKSNMTASISVQALSAGHLSLPETQFISPASETKKLTVPSLSFLITHSQKSSGKTTRILFDLGLRRDVLRYPTQIQQHIKNRQPLSTSPDVVSSLSIGGLKPDDIDYVIYSHVCVNELSLPDLNGDQIADMVK